MFRLLSIPFLGRPFVNRFAVRYLTVVCPVCLSVTLVYWGQTVGLMKTKHSLEVGLGPCHIVLDGTQLSQKGHSLNLRPISVVAKLLDGLRCHLMRM